MAVHLRIIGVDRIGAHAGFWVEIVAEIATIPTQIPWGWGGGTIER
jgi:hypothetical protein